MAGQLGIRHGAVPMGMLPGPQAGALRALHNLAILLPGIHQGHIALVLLRLLIHQIKDALRTCQGHDNGVKLLGNLRNRLRKLSRHLQKGRQRTQIQPAANRQHSPQSRRQRIMNIR